MNSNQIFPTILIVLDVCAAVMFATEKNVNQTIYWVSAAVLTTSVTFKFGVV